MLYRLAKNTRSVAPVILGMLWMVCQAVLAASPADGLPDLSEPSTDSGGLPAHDSVPAAVAPKPLEVIDLGTALRVAAGDPGRGRPLDVMEMVHMVLANNPDIKMQRLQPELGETDVRRALGLFDPKFVFNAQYSESDLPQNAEDFVATGGETTQTQLALIDQLTQLQNELSQLLDAIQGGSGNSGGSSTSDQVFNDPRIFSSSQTLFVYQLEGQTPLGTRYSFGFNQSVARNDINNQIPPSLFYPETTSTLAFNLTQPLLKNFGPAATMAGVRIARLQRRIGWYEWEQQMIRSLAEALLRYFDLVFAFQDLTVRRQAVDAARLLETQNIRRVASGKMRPSDVWEAQTSLSFNSDNALRAINTYVEAQNSVKNLIYRESDLLQGPTPALVPSTELTVPTVAIERNRFVAEAMANRPEYRNLIARAEQDGVRVRFARNQAYPEVDLQASYGLNGLEQEYGSSFGNMVDGQGTQFTVGVVVSIPLGNIEGRANLDAAKLRERQTRYALERAAMNMAIEVDTAISLLETSRLQMEAAEQTAVAAAKTAEAEERLLEEGKSTTFEVVRLQNNAADARSRRLTAVASYRKNVVRLAVARGTLLNDLGISLEREAWRDVRKTKPRNKDFEEFEAGRPVQSKKAPKP